jgi:Cu2+-containing amine oxidase
VFSRTYADRYFEIGVFAEIGGYDLFQFWRFGADGNDGTLEPFLSSNGWSCNDNKNENDHRHYPYWRIDFDVEGVNNELWEWSPTGSTPGKVSSEGNRKWTSADQMTYWTINMPGSAKHVLVRYPKNELADEPGSPWFEYSNRDISVRLHKTSEDKGWDVGWCIGPGIGPGCNEKLKYDDPAEPIAGRDIIFWSVGHLSHTWTPEDFDKPQPHVTGFEIRARGF